LYGRDPADDMSAPAVIAPFALEGQFVRLEPLAQGHVEALTAVGTDPRIWEFSRTLLENRDDVEKYVARALAARETGVAFPFVTIDRSSGRVVGSTRFENIELAERRLEIGWSWLAPDWWRTPINTEAKYLMLRHAFGAWGCARVEFKVLLTNQRSIASITRIGAVVEGVHRRRLLYRDGTLRDVLFLSMLDDEWPAVRVALERRLYG
jgi:N-acetyltransferase